MDDDMASSGMYCDYAMLYNADGDICKCSLVNPPKEWCGVCSACFTCTKENMEYEARYSNTNNQAHYSEYFY